MSATVKVKGKVYYNVEYVEVMDSEWNDKACVAFYNEYRQWIDRVLLSKSSPIQVIVTGNVNTCNSHNVLTVFGNIQICNTRLLYCDGFVKNWQCNYDRGITVNRNIPIEYGNDHRSRNGFPSVRHQIVHIEGNLSILNVKATNVELDPVVKGNMGNVVVGNVLNVKGNVGAAKFDICESTLGKSTAKSIKKFKQERKQQEDNLDRLFNDIFNGGIFKEGK